ncbi:AAA family ATPase [Aquimarina sediminis]|uniref:AAA family ATPase n=1 Tax=Aquimarina sediminis TaxID=2070536 RepID=UPI000CA0673A|nr:AAA family ATPase [Aquimarina sediminis]
MHKRYIITGAPGTGKTSLINALQENNYLCFAEVSRKIIIEQQQKKSNKTPWADLSGFAHLVYLHTIEELQLPVEKNSFSDRGLPDIMAYLKSKDYVIPKHLLDFSYKKYYAPTVFLLPPWKEIYTTDPQRLQSYPEAVHIHQYLTEVYESLNFSIELLPKTTLEERVDFIKSFIS